MNKREKRLLMWIDDLKWLHTPQNILYVHTCELQSAPIVINIDIFYSLRNIYCTFCKWCNGATQRTLMTMLLIPIRWYFLWWFSVRAVVVVILLHFSLYAQISDVLHHKYISLGVLLLLFFGAVRKCDEIVAMRKQQTYKNQYQINITKPYQ